MAETTPQLDLTELEPSANCHRRATAARLLLSAAFSNGVARSAPNRMAAETPRPTYQEFKPPPKLRKHVACLWRHGPTMAPTTARVIPDGCVDVVWVGDRPPHVAGPMTEPVLYTIDAGTEIVAVRLRPGSAQRLLGESAKDLLNQDVPLRDLWPSERATRWEDVAAKSSEHAKLVAMAEVIAARLEAVPQTDDFVAQAASWMAHHPFSPLEELAHLSGLSGRQVRRRFDEAVGYGPKKLQRILRLQRLLWLAGQKRGAYLHLSALAFAAGYADQPHMTRVVIALTGVSPGRLLRGSPRSAVSEMFKTPAP